MIIVCIFDFQMPKSPYQRSIYAIVAMNAFGYANSLFLVVFSPFQEFHLKHRMKFLTKFESNRKETNEKRSREVDLLNEGGQSRIQDDGWYQSGIRLNDIFF